MKLRSMHCPRCEQNPDGRQWIINTCDLFDDLTFRGVCPAGHEAAFVAQAQKFEVLFDMGLSALLDGYAREAVSSFAAAQERFHEFCLRVFCKAQGIQKDQFDKTWKLVSNQSERQLGAYYFLSLLQFGTAPTANQRMVEFRNRVIHKGHIPNREDTIKFAEFVYDETVSVCKLLRASLKPQIEQVCREDVAEVLASIDSGIATRTFPSYSTIWLSGPDEKFGRRPFSQVLKDERDDHRLELENRLEEMEEECEEEDE